MTSRLLLTLALVASAAHADQFRRFQRNTTAPLAFFEFAPASGAGLGSPCSPPNWVTSSETFNSGWTLANSVAALPVVTADFGVAPDGTTTADRVQFAATSGTQFSFLFQSAATIASGWPATGSVYIKGNGTSGTINLGLQTPVITSLCNYNATTWTRCSISYTANSASTSFVIGNDSFNTGGVVFAANDVLLWGGMVNVGSTPAPYVKTVAAYVGPPVTGAKGEAVTWTRASGAMCTRSASESSIANGDLVYTANNQPRVMSLGGPLGVLVESSRTNNLIQSQAIDNASWSKSQNGTPGLPVATVDQTTAPDGTVSAERVVYPTTGAAQSSFTGQTGGCGATVGPKAGTVYVKGNGASGTIDVCIDFPMACSSCNYTSTSWTRCSAINSNSASAHNFYVGNMTNQTTIARAANDVFVWGAQCEDGAYATSYSPTVASATIRSADQGSFTISSGFTTKFSASLTARLPLSVLANADVLYAAGAGSVFEMSLPSVTQFKNYVSTPLVSSTAATATTANTTNGVAGYFDGTNVGACVNGSCTNTAGAPVLPALPWTVNIGGFSSTSFNSDSIISLVKIDPDSSRCR